MNGLGHFKTEQVKSVDFAVRRRMLLGLMLFGMAMLVCRAVFLQVFDSQFLQHQGDILHISVVSVPAYRGKILDRNNEPLAISTPVESVWVNPQHFIKEEEDKFWQVAKLLKVPSKKLDGC